MSKRQVEEMRLVGIENPCLQADREEYLLFEEEDRIDLGTELAILYLKIVKPKDQDCFSRYDFAVDLQIPSVNKEEFDQAIREYIDFEFADRLHFGDEVVIRYTEQIEP